MILILPICFQLILPFAATQSPVSHFQVPCSTPLSWEQYMLCLNLLSNTPLPHYLDCHVPIFGTIFSAPSQPHGSPPLGSPGGQPASHSGSLASSPGGFQNEHFSALIIFWQAAKVLQALSHLVLPKLDSLMLQSKLNGWYLFSIWAWEKLSSVLDFLKKYST